MGCIILERLVSEVNGRREARLKEVERIRKVKEGRMERAAGRREEMGRAKVGRSAEKE